MFRYQVTFADQVLSLRSYCVLLNSSELWTVSVLSVFKHRKLSLLGNKENTRHSCPSHLQSGSSSILLYMCYCRSTCGKLHPGMTAESQYVHLLTRLTNKFSVGDILFCGVFQCMEQWLRKRQTCPMCLVHVSVIKALYWSSSRTTVP
ncbi:hypothetical protein XENOCAPTIV_020894 [Xenoophorus captivus]|uniref:Uncharacterized protein n=1 Tax=Xenoophorus captivus TaxID=1517983 RepID=A0ABV0RBG3_9TELE